MQNKKESVLNEAFCKCINLHAHIRKGHSLCSVEGQLEVVPALVWVKDGILKGVREKTVHQGTKRYAITPAGGEVTDLHPLIQPKRKYWHLKETLLRRK